MTSPFHCFICTETAEIVAIGTCDHPICWACSLRLRALYGTKECPLCKTPLDLVIYTPLGPIPGVVDATLKTTEEGGDVKKQVTLTAVIPTYAASLSPGPPLPSPGGKGKHAPSSKQTLMDNRLGILFTTPEIKDLVHHKLSFACPECGEVSARGWPEFRHHLKSVHSKMVCDLCSRFLKVFPHQQPLFDNAQSLREHKLTGGSDPSFKGHPSCASCKVHFYDADVLFTHCRERHEQCHICIAVHKRIQPTAPPLHEYWRDYAQLEAHFRADHFQCLDPGCLERKFVVFETELDLIGHRVAEHGDKRTKSRGQAVNLEFTSSSGSAASARPKGNRSSESSPPASSSAVNTAFSQDGSRNSTNGRNRAVQQAPTQPKFHPPGRPDTSNGGAGSTEFRPVSCLNIPAGFGARLSQAPPPGLADVGRPGPDVQKSSSNNISTAPPSWKEAGAGQATRSSLSLGGQDFPTIDGTSSLTSPLFKGAPAPVQSIAEQYPSLPSTSGPSLSSASGMIRPPSASSPSTSLGGDPEIASKLTFLLSPDPDGAKASRLRDVGRTFRDGHLPVSSFLEEFLTLTIPSFKRGNARLLAEQEASKVWHRMADTLPEVIPTSSKTGGKKKGVPLSLVPGRQNLRAQEMYSVWNDYKVKSSQASAGFGKSTVNYASLAGKPSAFLDSASSAATGQRKVLVISSNSAKPKAPVRGVLGGITSGSKSSASVSSLTASAELLSLDRDDESEWSMSSTSTQPPVVTSAPTMIRSESMPSSSTGMAVRLNTSKTAFPALPPTNAPKRHTVASLRASKVESTVSPSTGASSWLGSSQSLSSPSTSSAFFGGQEFGISSNQSSDSRKGGKSKGGKQVLLHFG